MKIPDNVLKQYFELVTDLDGEQIENIMNGDIREAHFRFAKELIEMYDKGTDFNIIKDKYNKIASGGIPNDIKETKIKESQINICELLLKIGFSSSKSEAKRMIQGKGVKIDSQVIEDINTIIEFSNEKVVQFGKNKFIKVKFEK